jgi:hypothetical protein
MAIDAPVSLAELLPRIRELLAGAQAADRSAHTPESRALLSQLEALIEDLMDLQESVEALQEAHAAGPDSLRSWQELKAELGL